MLGVSEGEIIERLDQAVEQILMLEEGMRNQMTGAEADRLTDRVRRAEGILRFAHLLTMDELLGYISDLRLGATMGLTSLRVEALTALMFETMPATLTLSMQEGEHPNRDILRARVVKEGLFGA